MDLISDLLEVILDGISCLFKLVFCSFSERYKIVQRCSLSKEAAAEHRKKLMSSIFC